MTKFDQKNTDNSDPQITMQESPWDWIEGLIISSVRIAIGCMCVASLLGVFLYVLAEQTLIV